MHELRAALYQTLAVFALPLGLSCWLAQRGLAAPLAVAAALPVAPVLALAVFWLAWLELPAAGAAHFADWAVCILGFAFAALALGKREFRYGEIALPFAAAIVASFILTGWMYAGAGGTDTPLRIAATRWTHPLPGDNALPFDFASGFFAGRIPHFLQADWLSSDRPPLQTALYMVTPLWLHNGPEEYGYQAAGIALQMTVLLGAWVLLRALAVTRSMAIVALVAVFFTPFVVVNGAFVWPKLLPAGFLLAAAALHLTPYYDAVKQSAGWGAVIGALLALAMLGHGGSAFAIIGIGVAAILTGRFASARYVASAAAVFLALYMPWLAYQRYADPPGDGLLKMHLAGVDNADPRPLLQAIEDRYRAATWADIVDARRSDVEAIFGNVAVAYGQTAAAAKDLAGGSLAAARALLHDVRIEQFFDFVIGSGLLGFGLYLLPLALLWETLRPLALATAATLLVWIALMFDPVATIIHQGSFFPELAVLLGVLAAASRRAYLPVALVVAHSVLTVFQYTL